MGYQAQKLYVIKELNPPFECFKPGRHIPERNLQPSNFPPKNNLPTLPAGKIALFVATGCPII